MHLIVDTDSGRQGSPEEWVAAFADVWRGGVRRLPDFMRLMSPDIRLVAPGLKTTEGRAAGHEAFRRTFVVLPDLVADVHDWAWRHDSLFIEMSFRATIGRERVTWRNVDRFRFVQGRAVERVAFFNPTRGRRAFLRHPRGWMQLLRRIRIGL